MERFRHQWPILLSVAILIGTYAMVYRWVSGAVAEIGACGEANVPPPQVPAVKVTPIWPASRSTSPDTSGPYPVANRADETGARR